MWGLVFAAETESVVAQSNRRSRSSGIRSSTAETVVVVVQIAVQRCPVGSTSHFLSEPEADVTLPGA